MWGFKKDRVVLVCLLSWSATIVRTTDGSSVTWHEPPPSETVTDTAITSTTDTNVTKGSLNEEVSCNFSLTSDMSVFAVSFELGNVAVASYLNGRYPTVADRFVSRFNVTWVPSKLTLIVFNVTSDDKGEYRCRVQALSGGLKTWLRIIKVDVLVQAQITNITGKTVTEGGNVTMNCLVEGNPTPTVTWRRLSDNHVVTMPLTNIRRQNASVGYRCIAGNGVRTPAIVEAFIDVQYPVEPIGNGENATVIEGGVKNFSCAVDGNPKPTIMWYNGIRGGGKIIYSGKEFEAREAGCYTCVAKNSLGPSVSIMHCLKVNASKELSTAIIVTNPTRKPTPISEDPPWIIIGVVVGVVVVMVPVIGFVTWRIRKKKKKNYRRETKHGDLHYEGVANFDSLVRTATSEHQKPDSDE